ncbi:hypothetical protein [Candidatus Chloroploca sp. Khr17]|uniref:hypothetical protein n=1 Tax=Candidatus Chloroploca sp. Khr17 TaxID=2496869 RepID=UPI00101B7AE3|nr:hypothetical protein [Candidatus Chloroploca sp. Khr17]
MKRKTQGVYDLTKRVLQTMNSPYSEDIIEEVFLAIEANTEWLQNYKELNGTLGNKVVNSWIGRYVKEIAAMKTIREVPAKRSYLIKDYTKLSY